MQSTTYARCISSCATFDVYGFRKFALISNNGEIEYFIVTLCPDFAYLGCLFRKLTSLPVKEIAKLIKTLFA